MPVRTDLAIESSSAPEKGKLKGVKSSTRDRYGVKVTEVEVMDKDGASVTGKPIGRYVTLELEKLSPERLPMLCKAAATELISMIPDNNKPVLVMGLGNRRVTPDMIGPLAIDNLLVTRHLFRETPKVLGLDGFRAVSAIQPGVTGETGMDAAELLSGIANVIKPETVIVIDALAARSLSRLLTTIQLSNTGITPGSGVGNGRTEISQRTVGVPVLSVGIPTVVDAETLAYELTGVDTQDAERTGMMVTTKEIDSMSVLAGKLLGRAISMALHNISYDELAQIEVN